MRAHQTIDPDRQSRSFLSLIVREPEAPWAAVAFAEDVPPATLEEARDRRSVLARLLASEQAACADFLLALADFDRRRGWERLGHGSLFAFLTRELGLSAGAAQLRLSAARLLRRHQAVEAALRDGQLCLSAVGQLARVLTPGNEAAVLPRFFGRSAREAADVVAALLPREAAPVRDLVTAVTRPGHAVVAPPPAPPAPAPLHTYEVVAPPPARPRTPAVEPLTADLRRLHLTVSRGFLEKVAAARTGLSHAMPGASTEQVLEAALDLLLERQARAKALVKRPRRARVAAAKPRSAEAGGAPRAILSRPHLPASIEREVRTRDGDSCQHPLEVGGVCGSTWQIELDHVVPLALGGETTAANLRCLCAEHHRLESERALGRLARARTPHR